MKKASNGTSKTKKPRKTPKTGGHKLATTMPQGTVLVDLMKQQWKLGKPIGSGGFGLIYLTQSASSSVVKDDADFVMKLEPHENGPLFCELHFYQRAAKSDLIKEWMTSHSLKSLGMPKFIASGQHECNGEKYRFMVMQRFGTDLQKLFETNDKQFPAHTVFLLGFKLLHVLEYIHDKGYVHADIKASNLLTGFKDPHEVYLIDYGLAHRFSIDGKHKDYKEDPRKAHDGTVEFTSRDAHKGVAPSRRGDLEILGYCLLQWLCQKLPWENNLMNKDYVRDQKIRYMSDIPGLLTTCLSTKKYPELNTYLTYVAGLKYEEEPSYSHCRQLFSQAIKRLGHKESEKLDFSKINASDGMEKPSVTKPSRKRTSYSFSSTFEDSSSLRSSAKDGQPRWRSQSPLADEEAAMPASKVSRKRMSSKSPMTSQSRPVDDARSPLHKAASKASRKRIPSKSPMSSRSRLVEDAKSPLNRAPSAAFVRETRSPEGSPLPKRPKPAGPLKKSPATSRATARLKKKSSSIATQTSPGLRGLPRSRRGR